MELGFFSESKGSTCVWMKSEQLKTAIIWLLRLSLRLAGHFKVVKTTKQVLKTSQNNLVVGKISQNK